MKHSVNEEIFITFERFDSAPPDQLEFIVYLCAFYPMFNYTLEILKVTVVNYQFAAVQADEDILVVKQSQ